MLAPFPTLPRCHVGRKEPHHCLHQVSSDHSPALGWGQPWALGLVTHLPSQPGLASA